jgi:uncharacterized protein (TIGR02246 family)
MKTLAFVSLLSVMAASPALSAVSPATADRVRAEVSKSLKDMGAAANAHDVDRHVEFYAHDPAVTLIFNGVPIVGWEAIRDKQREWWKDGKTDVVYTPQGRPEIRVMAPDVVVTTLLMKSHRTGPSGEISEGEFAVSDVWQKRPEGWRVIYGHESTTH